MIKLNYIKGKGLSTKSLPAIVTGHFSVNKEDYTKLMSMYDIPLSIKAMSGDKELSSMSANINDESSTPLMYNSKDDHGVVKLDIFLKEIVDITYVLFSDLSIDE